MQKEKKLFVVFEYVVGMLSRHNESKKSKQKHRNFVICMFEILGQAHVQCCN